MTTKDTVSVNGGAMPSDDLKSFREMVSDQIEKLIAFLDATDGYSLEERESDDSDPTNAEIRLAGERYDGHEDDEPSLGWTPQEAAHSTYWELAGHRYSIDLEHQCDDEGDISDSGIADADGLVEQLSGIRNVGGIGSTGFATHAE
jgi:hypothetical protein